MADENATAAPPPAVRKSQEELNVEMYHRIYENCLKKAEELGKPRGWVTADVLEATRTMYEQYFADQVSLSKDHKMRAMVAPLMERLQELGLFRR